MVSTEKPGDARSAGRAIRKLAKQRLATSVCLSERRAVSPFFPLANAVLEHVTSHTEIMNAEVHNSGSLPLDVSFKSILCKTT